MNTVAVERYDGWIHAILNRPEKRNSLSPELLAEFQDVLLSADADKSVHAILISGAGQDFCTGYYNDPSGYAPASLDADIAAMETQIQQKIMTIFDMHKPVVAMIHGRCNAGGTDLAFMCDIVLAADDAIIGFPPVRDLGSPPNPMWLYHVGPQWAKRLLFTGDRITGDDAARIGLVLKALPLEKLKAEAFGLMRHMAKIDHELLAAHKRSVNLGLELMGARTMQRLGLELNARAHDAPTARAFEQEPAGGRKDAIIEDRLGKFGDGLATVVGPDSFDDDGRLIAGRG